jgi:hypothetical protein
MALKCSFDPNCATARSLIWSHQRNLSVVNVDHFNCPDCLQLLFVSVLLTAFSLLLRSPHSSKTFRQRAHTAIVGRPTPSSQTSKAIQSLTKFLPTEAFPLVLLLRLPILILALRKQIFLHPSPPFTISSLQTRILSSERSLSGQIVVSDNLEAGYRYLRCDHSMLGGRYMRQTPDRQGDLKTQLGDSSVPRLSIRLENS